MINKIMVPLDGSKLAECVLPYADELGAKLGAEVVLITVTKRVEAKRKIGDIPNDNMGNALSYETPLQLEQDEYISEEAVCANEESTSKYLKEVSETKLSKNVKVSMQIMCGEVARELNIYANTSGVDMVLISSHGRSGPGKLLLGSIAEKVSKGVNIPVMMIRAPGCEIKI